MALPTNTLATFEAVGNREDLSNIIYDVSPTETPVLSSIPKTKATGTKHEWITRALAAASGSNFVLEGDDATTDAANTNTRVINYRAISDKVARVTGTQEAVNKVAVKSSMALEMEDKMKELKRDVETIILQNNAYVVGTDTTAPEAAGLQAYVKTATDIASDATASAGNGSTAHTDGTARALTESMFESVLATAWTNGGMPSLGVSNAFQKRKVASFSGSASKQLDAMGKKVVNSVDIYIDPLGSEIRMVPDRYCPTDVVFFIDPAYLKFATLRDFSSWDLAKTGDSIRKQIIVEYTLEVCNEKAHAGIYDLTAS